MASFNTGFGQNDFAYTVKGSAPSGARPSTKYAADFIPLRSIQASQHESDDREQPSLCPGRNTYEVEVAREQSTERSSLGSGKSEEMIIRKQVTVTVDHARRR